MLRHVGAITGGNEEEGGEEREGSRADVPILRKSEDDTD